MYAFRQKQRSWKTKALDEDETLLRKEYEGRVAQLTTDLTDEFPLRVSRRKHSFCRWFKGLDGTDVSLVFSKYPDIFQGMRRVHYVSDDQASRDCDFYTNLRAFLDPGSFAKDSSDYDEHATFCAYIKLIPPGCAQDFPNWFHFSNAACDSEDLLDLLANSLRKGIPSLWLRFEAFFRREEKVDYIQRRLLLTPWAQEGVSFRLAVKGIVSAVSAVKLVIRRSGEMFEAHKVAGVAPEGSEVIVQALPIDLVRVPGDPSSLRVPQRLFRKPAKLDVARVPFCEWATREALSHLSRDVSNIVLEFIYSKK
jgi:hypothetical protein